MFGKVDQETGSNVFRFLMLPACFQITTEEPCITIFFIYTLDHPHVNTCTFYAIIQSANHAAPAQCIKSAFHISQELQLMFTSRMRMGKTCSQWSWLWHIFGGLRIPEIAGLPGFSHISISNSLSSSHRMVQKTKKKHWVAVLQEDMPCWWERRELNG